ncbi:hypothetical protein ABH933_001239 [Nocardia sp. GP40]|uniref:hypothetical protein n=1 Tax=Nocardia sp. GP40 TaxID=3156268 RepID=UPI003D240AF1
MADLAEVYDEAAQDAPDWIEWDDQRRCFLQIDQLFDTSLPASSAAQNIATGKTVPPWPQVPRYSHEMLIWVEQAAFALFPNQKALADNTDVADRVVCYLVEYLVRKAGGLRMNVPGNGTPVYTGFGPSVCYSYTSEVDNPVDMLVSIGEHGDGFAEDITARVEDYTDSLM